MRNKNGIIFLTAIITLLCLYMLSFTFVARRQQAKALEYATNSNGEINISKKQQYLDKIFDSTVYNFAGLKYTYKEVLENQLALGLDLQGGMHVTLEASPVEILTALAGSNAGDPTFKQALQNAKQKQKNSQQSFASLFYDSYREIAGADQLHKIYSNAINRSKQIDSRSKDAAIEKVINEEIENAIDRAENILRTRIDKFGAVQPNIQRLKGSGRIQVELPGVENQQRVRNLLQGAAKLEFLEVYQIGEIAPALTQINSYLLTIEKPKTGKDGKSKLDKSSTEKLLSGDTLGGTSDSNTVASASPSKADSAKADTTAPKASSLFTLLKAPNTLRYDIKDTAKINDIFAMEKVKGMLPSGLLLLWDKKPYKDDKSGEETLELVPVKKARAGSTVLTGEVIVDARADLAQDGKNFEISMQMNSLGAKRWKKMTAEAASDPRNKKRIAIVLDDYVYSAPTVQNEIPNGNSSITGNFTFEDAKDLENILKSGKLPVPLRIVEEVVVGPTLGKEAIQQGLVSMLAGLGVVVLFMVLYYSKGGLVADTALLFNVLFVLGIMASLPSGAVLTLPGIAGIVLTIGMSVDANVLIFERIREELTAGKSLTAAIDLGYDKAFSSIFDSNVTTLLAGGILMVFGSGPVQGFAITLIIGIICSFFTSVYISKVIILFITRNKDPKSVSFSTVFSRNMFKNLNFDIIGKRKLAYVFSSALLIFGAISIFIQGGLNLGVDFKGGRSYIIQFEKPIVASELKDALSDDFKSASTEVKTFGSNEKLKVTTSYLMEDESTEADNKVAATLSKGLNDFQVGKFEILSTNKVGATVADDIQNSSWKALLISLLGIFIYVLIRFKKWEYSFGGVIALLHDALMVIAIFSILRLFGIAFEIDQVFVAAILTIVGFSINDTVVVFDRVREFIGENPKMDLATVLNNSINHTFSRTIITSMTVLIVVLILCVFGGETLRGFSFAMLIGVVFGSYSSIFIAVPIVLDVQSKQKAEVIAVPQPKKPVGV